MIIGCTIIGDGPIPERTIKAKASPDVHLFTHGSTMTRCERSLDVNLSAVCTSHMALSNVASPLCDECVNGRPVRGLAGTTPRLVEV